MTAPRFIFVACTLAALAASAQSPFAHAPNALGSISFAELDADEAHARRIARTYADLAGDEDNGAALALALRNGERVTLVAALGDHLPEVTYLEAFGRALEWREVERALERARRVLHDAGITRPSTHQLHAVLHGGDLGLDEGRSQPQAGVLETPDLDLDD